MHVEVLGKIPSRLEPVYRKSARSAPGFGLCNTAWGKHALAAYTWTRSNRGPQKSWLHHIGKAESPSCPCGHATQDGNHLVFACPLLHAQRERLLPPEADCWEALDAPHWIAEAGEDGKEQEKTEGVETFFQDIYWTLRNGAEEGRN